MPPPTAVSASLALALAGAADPAGSQEITVRSDSAGIEIVTSDPSLSDAICTLGEEPIFRVGNDESDEATWFSTIRGMGRATSASSSGTIEIASSFEVF